MIRSCPVCAWETDCCYLFFISGDEQRSEDFGNNNSDINTCILYLKQILITMYGEISCKVLIPVSGLIFLQ